MTDNCLWVKDGYPTPCDPSKSPVCTNCSAASKRAKELREQGLDIYSISAQLRAEGLKQ